MKLTRNQRSNRRRQRKIEKYLRDREGEPMFPLSESIANELGDILPGTLLTKDEYERCCERVALIRAGLVRKSTRNERLGRLYVQQAA